MFSLLTLSQGEYLAPEKIEGIYVRSKYVAQVFVDGDSLKVSIQNSLSLYSWGNYTLLLLWFLILSITYKHHDAQNIGPAIVHASSNTFLFI